MNTPLPTSIRLFLAEGAPDGLLVVEKSNWTGLALMAKRSRFPVLRARTELNGPGVYVLVGPPEGVEKATRIYIGESDVLRDRLDSHQSKEFWTKVVVFTAKDSNLNKAHVRYLESRLLSIATEANRAELENRGASTLPSLSEADRADMEAFLADMLMIYPILGLNAFERADEPNATRSAERFLLNRGGTVAKGHETSDGFVVHEGALGLLEVAPSLHAFVKRIRKDLTEAGVLVVEGDRLRLTQDFVFQSPSTAAMVLIGKSSNGRVEWKTSTGRTLKKVQEEVIGAG